MKVVVGFGLLISAATFSPSLRAQAAGGDALSEAALYSLYVKRHDAMIALADLAVSHTSNSDVRKAAEALDSAHVDARAKLVSIATERHLTLAPPEHDTSSVLLEQARKSLDGKGGRAFDSTWVNLAYNLLSTLILDNNRVVKGKVGPDLQLFTQEHTTWLFHQSAELDKLRKKFK